MAGRKKSIHPFKRASEITPDAPALAMCDPKFPHNVGAAIRAASCFGVRQVWVTGRRCADQVWGAQRIPREERMKGYRDVDIVLEDAPLRHLPSDVVPVAVELLRGAENLLGFEHPDKALYVFGPEDGSIPRPIHQHCHRRVFIPVRHCVNLSSAVYLLLYDRMIKAHAAGEHPMLPLEQVIEEQRGWPNDDLPRFTA